MRKCAALVCLIGVFSGVDILAQEGPPPGWTAGPITGRLGTKASVSVPEGYFFLDVAATRKFLEDGQNIPDGDELGTIFRAGPGQDDYWFAVFSYSETGHIDDGEKNDLDADALMKQLREGQLASNQERQKRGWPVLILEGWQQPPFYDPATNNLTWATRLLSDGGLGVNRSVRLLGRTGLMSAQLVADASTIEQSTTEFNTVLRGYSFNEGFRYAEFRPGDKIAAYGLTALIAGGAGAAAVKSGLFQKFWKLLVLGFIALAGAIKKLFSTFFGSGEREPSPSSGGQNG